MKDSRVENIFNAALHKVSPAERLAYLEGACGHDADLRARVETLLRAHDEAGAFMQQTCEAASSEGPGSVIGRYKLLQLIGEGGFGAVYMAEQLEPVRRKVALKIIKLGMDTRQVVARFESERQALALMDHVNIARVFDAGATDSGRPYFVMELVRGIPITEYCDKNNLPPRDRLELFIPVCHAVQHAHQKGIIHRDLKPTNVLVTLHDGRPVPKVIDFGIAKATNQRLTEKTLFTEFRQFIGTPQYMSPEQAEMSGLDVDTRSDIYSLGVVLYELLTGTTPLAAETLRAGGYGEMQRIIREEEPPSPSVRVSTMHDQMMTIAKHRNVEPAALSKVMRGDLDWIVMKALEKDRTRRYSTASDLAADIERHLRNEPVQASPPSAVYRFTKFVRRYRAAVSAVASIVAALVIGCALATVGFMKARQSAAQASDEAVRATHEADRASREAARSQAIADFLQEVLASIDPAHAAASNTDVQSVVERARELFGNDHVTVAATLSSLALQLQHSGNWSRAEPLYRESIQIARRSYGDRHASIALTLGRLGTMLRQKGDDDGAEQALREAVSIADGLPDEANLVSCESRTELARLLQKRGKLAEAEQLVRDALRIRRAWPAGQEFQIASNLEQLTGILTFAGKEQEAETAFEETIAAYKPLFPPDSPTAAWLHLSYGLWLRQRGKNDKSEPFIREAVRIYRANPNPPRDYYAAALDALFQIVRKREESFDETVSVFHETMDAIGHLYGRDHLLLAPHLVGFASMLEQRDRAADAIPLVIDSMRIYRRGKGDDWDASSSLKMLERFVRRLVLVPELDRPKYEVALSGVQAMLNEKPDDAAYSLLLGMAHFRLGQFQDAHEKLAEVGVAAIDTPEAASDRVQQLAFLAMTQTKLGLDDAARQTLDEARKLVADEAIGVNKDARVVFTEAQSLLGM